MLKPTQDKEARKKQIIKAIKLIGWFETGQRLKSDEDKSIFTEVSAEFDKTQKINDDHKLKKAGIIL